MRIFNHRNAKLNTWKSNAKIWKWIDFVSDGERSKTGAYPTWALCEINEAHTATYYYIINEIWVNLLGSDFRLQILIMLLFRIIDAAQRRKSLSLRTLNGFHQLIFQLELFNLALFSIKHIEHIDTIFPATILFAFARLFIFFFITYYYKLALDAVRMGTGANLPAVVSSFEWNWRQK